MRRRQFLGLVTGGVVAGLAGVSLAVPPTGKPAPEFSMSLLDGRTIALKDFRGKPVVVDFWSST